MHAKCFFIRSLPNESSFVQRRLMAFDKKILRSILVVWGGGGGGFQTKQICIIFPSTNAPWQIGHGFSLFSILLVKMCKFEATETYEGTFESHSAEAQRSEIQGSSNGDGVKESANADEVRGSANRDGFKGSAKGD